MEPAVSVQAWDKSRILNGNFDRELDQIMFLHVIILISTLTVNFDRQVDMKDLDSEDDMTNRNIFIKDSFRSRSLYSLWLPQFKYIAM